LLASLGPSDLIEYGPPALRRTTASSFDVSSENSNFQDLSSSTSLTRSILRPRINRRSLFTEGVESTNLSSLGAEAKASPLLPECGLSELFGNENISSANERDEMRINRRSPFIEEADSAILSSLYVEANTSPLVPSGGLAELTGDENPLSANLRDEASPSSQSRSSFQNRCPSPTFTRNSTRRLFLDIRPRISWRSSLSPDSADSNFMALPSSPIVMVKSSPVSIASQWFH
jgi:hypothetical protein